MYLILALLLVYLVRRSFGLNPVVFADEWYYSKFSRLVPLSESILPSYLYLWIMRPTSACGIGFLDCARIINALAFVGAAPFIYLAARAFTGVKLAVCVAVIATMLPAGSFTAYFMPESVYYFGFWVLSWYALTRCAQNRMADALVLGAMLGVLSLIKVHALFLLPALCIYLVHVDLSDEDRPRSILHALLVAAAAVIAALATKLGLGYLLAGKEGLGLFGSFYSATADTAKPSSIETLLNPLFINGRGHMMTLAVLFAFPLALVGRTVVSAVLRRSATPGGNRLHVFTFLMLGSAIGVTVLYTASIVKFGPNEVFRLHMRYYDFAFPLLLIVAANAITEVRANVLPKFTWVLAAGFGILILLAPFKLPLYVLGHVDGPEIVSLVQLRFALYGIAALGLAILVLWGLNKKIAPVLFLFVLTPGILVVAEARLGTQMHYFVTDTEYDAAGKFARDNIPAAERGSVTVIGTYVGHLMRVLFYIDNKDANFVDVPEGAALRKEQIPTDKRWVIVVNPHPLPEGMPVVAQTREYTVLKFALPRTVGKTSMNGPLSGLIDRAEGLSGVEPMGRWSDAKQVTLHAAQALPKQFSLVLHAAAFGPNLDQPFIVKVGSVSREMRLGPTAADITLEFDTDGSATEIVIEVPKPTSPRSLGQSEDSRLLGIMLGSVTVNTTD